MTTDSVNPSRTPSIVGGWSLIAATILFGAVFAYLAATFDYPDILDGPAADVLPRLLSLGPMGRAVWVVYGLVPFLLIPTAIGVRAAAGRSAPHLAQAVVIMAVLSAICMAAGLLRWPSLQWELAVAHATGSDVLRESIAVTFNATNRYLGTYVGEFLGELFLNGFFLCSSIALARAAAPARQWLKYAGTAATLMGGMAMLRNLTPAVGPIAAANNSVLPIWMLVLGVALMTHGRSDSR